MTLRVTYDELDNRGFDAGGGEILYYQGQPFTGVIVEYRNGILLCEEEFDNGHIGGAQREYHSNGQIKEEYFITHNNYYGLSREWDEKGILIIEKDFGAKPIILDRVEYNAIDFQINPSDFFNGMKYKGELFTGTLVMNYYKADRKFIDFKHGNAHGKYLEYWGWGKIAVDSTYENGKPIIEKRWYLNGEIERDWNHSVSGKSWYDNGQIKEHWDGKDYIALDKDGKIANKNGSWLYKNGQKINERSDDRTELYYSSTGELAIKREENVPKDSSLPYTYYFYDKVLSSCYNELLTNYYPELDKSFPLKSILYPLIRAVYSDNKIKGRQLLNQLVNHRTHEIRERANLINRSAIQIERGNTKVVYPLDKHPDLYVVM